MRYALAVMIAAMTSWSAGLAGAQSLSEKYFDSMRPGAPARRDWPAQCAVTSIALERQSAHAGPRIMVTLKADGTALCQEYRQSDIIAVRRAELPANAFAGLARQAQQIGFFDLKDSYKSRLKDLSTVLTAVRVGDCEKIVSNYGGSGPAPLREFEAQIEALIKTLEWTPVQP